MTTTPMKLFIAELLKSTLDVPKYLGPKLGHLSNQHIRK